MSVIEEIAAERKRQIEIEGWTREHDEQHANGELANAAACYATTDCHISVGHSPHHLWPWHWSWFKRYKHPRRKQLIIAAALIVAEIERLDRETRSGDA